MNRSDNGRRASAREEAMGKRGVTFYVAANGNDGWSGRLDMPNDARSDGPFASIAGAQRAIRRLKKEGLKHPISVVVRGGVYHVRETLVFTPEDNGTEACPITYRAHSGEGVILTGGRPIRGWRPFREGMYQADLKAQGLEGASFHQLFYRGVRQILARYPDLDPEHLRTGGFLYVEAGGYRPRQEFFYEEGTIPFEEWGDISQAEVLTTFGRGWNFAITPITSVDTGRCLIAVQPVRRDFERSNRFIIQNVLGALDAPGEWFLDRKDSILYFYPPDGELDDGDVMVPVIDHLIEVKGSIPYPHGYLNVSYKGSREEYPMPEDAPSENAVEHLTFRGFHLECARQDAIRLIGARRCAVIGCRVTNVGAVGINLGGVASFHFEVGNPRVVAAEGEPGGVGGGGQNLLFKDPCQECRVVGNDVWAVGSDGIFLYGTGNVAENNHVYNSGLFDKDCACINVFGEENVARRNELHDVPRNAVFIKGIDNVIELNNIHHTMLETCDGGAIRMCQRNLTLRGNVIRFNRIFDTVGYGYPRGSPYQSPYYSWGVYLDDFTCGTTVYGNIIARTGRGGVMVHGGSDNVVENNIVVNAGSYQFESVPIRQHPESGNKVRRNIFFYEGDDVLLYHCTKWIEGSVTWERNLAWHGGAQPVIELGRGNIVEGWKAWRELGFDEGSVLADPRFENAAQDDYRLRADSPAWEVGFEKIPMEQIGCYEDAARASWPLRVDPALIREEPVLYEAPEPPLCEDFEREMANRPPLKGDVSAPGKSSITVTDETAAGGKQSLKMVDVPGLPSRWQPRIYYRVDFAEGKVRFACDVRLDGRQPPLLIVDFRQYSDTGTKEYFSGPSFSVDPEGQLKVGDEALMRVPLDEWFHVEIVMTLGDDGPTYSEMAVTVQGDEPRRFKVAHRSTSFHHLERIVIMSNLDKESVFYVDNVSCLPVEE